MAKMSRIHVLGPLEAYAEGFRASLVEQGYRDSATESALRLAAQFSAWLDDSSVSAKALTIVDVEGFERDRGVATPEQAHPRGSLKQLLAYLAHVGAVPVMTKPTVASASDALLADYKAYLTGERALAERSVDGYLWDAQHFLAWRCSRCDGELELDSLAARDLTSYVLAEHRRGSVASARRVVNALRSFLRYLHVEGMTAGQLAPAVLSVPGWRASAPPRWPLTAKEVTRLLSSFDRRSHLGRRNYAMVMLMLRLGLRAAEVAALDLQDVDWRQGEVMVSGKGHRQDRLPVPIEVGRAIAAYCERGRSRIGDDTLFLRGRAPYGRLSSDAVSAVVRSAGARVGISGVGAHQLRRTAACEMLQAGASLFAIGGVLRQRRLQTTSIYATVDHRDLGLVARPWPGGRS